MTNSTPLLPQSNSFNQGTVTLEEPSVPVSLEEFIECRLGRFGRMQFIQAILVSLMMFFDGQQTFISIFTDAEPTWHCVNTGIACNSSSNICDLPKSAWAWDAPSHKSIVSEWGLQCASSFISGLPASSFFMGCLVGGFIVATLGDSTLGRKHLLFLSCFAMSVTALATILSSSILVYSGFRFLTGLSRASIMASAIVLLMERVGNRRRGQLAIFGFFFFSFGLLSLPPMAYLNRSNSWRSLHIWTSMPAILYCILVFSFVCESPRWLFIHGRKVEALAVLNKLSSVSHDNLDTCLSNVVCIREATNSDLSSSINSLFQRGWARRRLVALAAVAFGVGMVYYGILLGVENLDFNIYLSVTLNGLMDIPALLLTFMLIEKWSRKRSVLGCCVLSGLSCILCVVAGDQQRVLQIGFEVASLLSVCVAFNVVLIYTTEIFPTVVRNSATSMVRQAINVGAVCGPVLIAAGRRNQFVQYGVFGLVVTCSGLCVIGLPETRGAALCDSLDEQEEKDHATNIYVT